jgi:hypothetical protein
VYRREISDVRSRWILWIILCVAALAFAQRARSTGSLHLESAWPQVWLQGPWMILWGILPIVGCFWVLKMIGRYWAPWMRVGSAMMLEGLWVALYPRAVLLAQPLGSTHSLEDQVLFAWVVLAVGALLVYAMKARDTSDWTFIFWLHRAVLISGALLVPNGDVVIQYMAVSWWIPFLFFTVNENGSASSSGSRWESPGIKVIWFACLLGWPPFWGGAEFMRAHQTLAWPSEVLYALWVVPVLALGLVFSRFGVVNISFRAGIGLLGLSLALAGFRFHPMVGMAMIVLVILAGVVFWWRRAKRDVPREAL